LRPAADPRVLRVLARIIADLDGLAGFPRIADEEATKGGTEAQHAGHRRRLAEPEPPPKQWTMRKERAALRALLNLPPAEKGGTSPVRAFTTGRSGHCHPLRGLS
jgi:hypothetical protein